MYINGMGSYHPEGIIDNQFIESLDVGTSAEWILEKIGILTRRTVLPLEYIKKTRNADPREAVKVATITPLQMALRATTQACERARIRASDIGMILCNCCTPRQTVPSEGQRLAHELGLNVPAYEVFTACPAFALHIDFLSSFQESALPDYILCVSTAALTEKVNYNDRSDGAIWGDGVAAWILSPRHPGKLKVISSFYTGDPTRSQAVTVDTFGHFHQDGRAVRDFSVRQTVRLIRKLESEHEINWKKDIFIGHQANRTMLSQICNNRDIPETNHWHNVSTIGNQAGAGAPAVMAMHWDEMKKEQKIIVAVVGAGLSWGSALLEVVS